MTQSKDSETNSSKFFTHPDNIKTLWNKQLKYFSQPEHLSPENLAERLEEAMPCHNYKVSSNLYYHYYFYTSLLVSWVKTTTIVLSYTQMQTLFQGKGDSPEGCWWCPTHVMRFSEILKILRPNTWQFCGWAYLIFTNIRCVTSVADFSNPENCDGLVVSYHWIILLKLLPREALRKKTVLYKLLYELVFKELGSNRI